MTLDQYWASIVYHGDDNKLSAQQHCAKVGTKVSYDFKILPIYVLRRRFIEKNGIYYSIKGHFH